MSTHAKVTTTGPLFDGTAAGAIADVIDDFDREFAEYTQGLILARLKKVLRHPTGYYSSKVVTNRASHGYEVNDSGVIYGPWLEGTGSRNRSTRFKGYATFRRTTQQADRQAVQFAEQLLAKRRAEMT